MNAYRPSLLLVDDVEANLLSAEAVLSGLKCEVVRARSGNEALRLLLNREFALILLDVQMPEMDGFEVAEHLRTNPKTKDLPIIFLTAMHQSETSALRGYGTGAVDYLLKPIDPFVLRSKVLVFLELFEKRRELSLELAQREKTLVALQDANEALRHFSQAASHDLRAPLRAVRGFLQGLEQEVGATLKPPASEYLRNARRGEERMTMLLDSLLAYAELGADLEAVEVSCAEAVRRVCADLDDRIRLAGAELQVSDLPMIRGYPARIYQLFLNLISNALKFRAPDVAPRIGIFVRPGEPEPCFVVEDNGAGIAPEQRASVFGAFKRLRPDVEGSGLGLAICRRIVEQHGGAIWAEAAEPRGARICFTLKGCP